MAWRSRVARADLWAAAAAGALVLLAASVAGVLYAAGRPVRASAAPLYAHWLPHVGPGTPAAVLLAALVVWHGPTLADTLPWRRLLAAGYAATVIWIASLALVDGWQRGLAGRLSTPHEYLSEVGEVTDVPTMLRGFTGRILDQGADPWTTHVAGHPPGALLVFVGLDRVGLGGGGWAAIACVLTGALVSVAVPVTLRALGHEPAGRTAVPFLILFPGAVWIGASADGLFAGVVATGVALVALGFARSRLACVAGGAVLAGSCYLSYGLVLSVPLLLAIVVTTRRIRPLIWVALGAGIVVAAFTIAGFWWYDGYRLVVERYYQGIASDRPYAYWVWANLAAVAVSAGPVAAVILRRAVSARGLTPVQLLPLVTVGVILAADLSGLSKAEVERIWLPFAVWFPAGAALLPAKSRRTWLVVQALTALLVNHLLLTTW